MCRSFKGFLWSFVSDSNLDRRLIPTERQPWRDIIWDICCLGSNSIFEEISKSELSFHSFFAFCSPHGLDLPHPFLLCCAICSKYFEEIHSDLTPRPWSAPISDLMRETYSKMLQFCSLLFLISFILSVEIELGLLWGLPRPLSDLFTQPTVGNFWIFFSSFVNFWIFSSSFLNFSIFSSCFLNDCDNLTQLWPNAKPFLFVYD